MEIQKEFKLFQIKLDSFLVPARVLRINDVDALESELAVFAKDRSVITKIQFHDFLLSTFVTNIGSIMFFAVTRGFSDTSFETIRDELISLVLEVNPELRPSNLVVNVFGVIKLKNEKVIGSPLIDSEFWDSGDVSKSILNPSTLEDNAKGIDDDIEADDNANSGLNESIKDTIAAVDALDHLKAKVWWDRITNYITIKKFDEETASEVLKKGNYNNSETYQTFLVTVLVVDVEDVFSFVESNGLLSKLSPQQIMNELYKLCIKVNPTLDYRSIDKKKHTAGRSCKKKQRTDNKTLNDISVDDIKKLDKKIKTRVIGQDKAIDTVTRAIRRAKVGIKDPKKPIGSFLFTGPTGVGKTETAKVLHQELMGKDGALIRIDCSEYSADHEYSKLIGAPHGYVGFEEGGQLTNKLMDKPFAVVLFDEIEKASHKVHQLLLQIMDDGIITDNRGNEVSFKDTVIIMTSNIGVDDVNSIKKRIGFGDVNIVNDETRGKALSGAVKSEFKPEFINRINEVVHFKGIDKKACKEIVKLELKYVQDMLEPRNIMVNFSSSVHTLILKKGYSEEYGAREVKRTIEKVVSDSMADFLLDSDISNNVILNTNVKRGKVRFKEVKFGQILEATGQLFYPDVVSDVAKR